MSNLTQYVVLTSAQHFGSHLPPVPTGRALVAIPSLVRQAISMAFRGRSRAPGRDPRWLTAASDLRFVGHAGDDQSSLAFEVPVLGEAAPELYEQGEFFWAARPSREDTGFDLVGDVLTDVANRNGDSDRFDPSLLRRLFGFRNVLGQAFQQICVYGRRYDERHPALLTYDTVAAAKRLYSETPAPKRIRLMGVLDMLRASTQTFALRLAGGQEIQGVLLERDVHELTHLFQQPVLVVGRAAFRASGDVLRIEADQVLPASDQDRFFAGLPRPARKKLHVRRIAREQQHKKGVEGIMGKWPGTETDEEVARALEELS